MKHRGQSLVEFALVVPIMLLLVVGGVDLARAFFIGIQITDGARQAALYASEFPTSYTAGDLTTIARQNGEAGGFLGCPGGSVSVTFTNSQSSPRDPANAGNAVTTTSMYPQPVTVTCEMPLFIPILTPKATIQATAEVEVVPPA